MKSVLTTTEIDSLAANAASVKRLQRRLGAGETAYANDGAGPRFIDRIPYIGFALESQLTLSSAHERLKRATEGVEPELHPDALFIMGRGTLINSGWMLLRDGQNIDGWISLPFPGRVLLEFLNFTIGVVPRVVRNGTALQPYLSEVSSVRTLPPERGLGLCLGDGDA